MNKILIELSNYTIFDANIFIVFKQSKYLKINLIHVYHLLNIKLHSFNKEYHWLSAKWSEQLNRNKKYIYITYK